MKGNKTEMYHWTLGEKNCSQLFFFFLLWTISKWISLLLQMLSLVLFGGTRLATSAVSDTRWPVSQSMGESEWGGEWECPLSASLLWSSGCQAAAPQRSTSSWAPLDPLSVWQEMGSSKTGQSRFSATQGISNRDPPPLDPAVVLPSPPSLSSLTQRSL